MLRRALVLAGGALALASAIAVLAALGGGAPAEGDVAGRGDRSITIVPAPPRAATPAGGIDAVDAAGDPDPDGVTSSLTDPGLLVPRELLRAARPASSAETATSDERDAPAPATAAPAPAPSEPGSVGLSIPSIGVAATVIRMGVDAAGVMEVPADADLVAWYEFTAFPGNPGNAVLSGHVDFRGRAGVFFRLSALSVGDEVAINVGGTTLRYVVDEAFSVPADSANVADLIGTRDGRQRITLITCGGEFDRARRQYVERVVVRASRVIEEAG